MKRIEAKTGKLKRRVRDRMRSVNKRVIAIATAGRYKGEAGEQKRKKEYRELLRLTRQILNDTRRVMEETQSRRKPGLRKLRAELSLMADRVKQVVKQTKARVFQGVTQLPGKIVSVFEPHAEIIRKGKASKPTEFGKLVQITKAENQIVTRLDVFDQRPSDRQLLTEAVKRQTELLGRAPQLVAADAGYYAQAHERAVEQMGVKWLAVPNRNTTSQDRKMREKSRWFKKAQAWRTGCEGRISVLKRTRIEPMPVSRNGRNEAVGRLGSAGRQSHQPRKGAECSPVGVKHPLRRPRSRSGRAKTEYRNGRTRYPSSCQAHKALFCDGK
jgi:IS5 family transposase